MASFSLHVPVHDVQRMQMGQARHDAHEDLLASILRHVVLLRAEKIQGFGAGIGGIPVFRNTQKRVKIYENQKLPP